MLIFLNFIYGRENSETKCVEFIMFSLDGMGSARLLGEGELDLDFLKMKLTEIRSFTCFSGRVLEVFS